MKEGTTRTIAIGSSIIFLSSCILYFLPTAIPQWVPVGILAATALILCPWQVCGALIFSAFGDYMGECGNFMAQMGSFALGHILFISYFTKRYLSKVEHDRKLTAKAKGYLAMVGLCTLFLLMIGLTRIAPAAPSGVLKIGVTAYSFLISGMLFTALIQRSSLFALGAVLFVFSDFILSWNMFVGPVPNAGIMIMATYFAAQWLIFIRSTKFRIAPEMRLLRF